MYATIAFAITMLGIFSIFENIKGGQKLSLLKYYMLLAIICLTISSFLDFLDLSGYSISYYKEITRLVGSILLLNMLYLVVVKKIPKIVVSLEVVYTLIFIVKVIFGFQFPLIKDEKIIYNFTIVHKAFYALTFLAFSSSFVYCAIQLYRMRHNQNLYDRKIVKWAAGLIISLLLLIVINLTIVVLTTNGFNTTYDDSIVTLFVIRTSVLFFILFRPRFLDDDSISMSFNDLFVQKSAISFEDFEFLFYKSHYYLNIEANLDDFALKLNHSKEDVLEFLKTQVDQSFAELLNQNRVDYLKQLLRSKKYESFTIEALSEMSGFGSRRSMYNYFNKYVGMTPSEFINTIN